MTGLRGIMFLKLSELEILSTSPIDQLNNLPVLLVPQPLPLEIMENTVVGQLSMAYRKCLKLCLLLIWAQTRCGAFLDGCVRCALRFNAQRTTSMVETGMLKLNLEKLLRLAKSLLEGNLQDPVIYEYMKHFVNDLEEGTLERFASSNHAHVQGRRTPRCLLYRLATLSSLLLRFRSELPPRQRPFRIPSHLCGRVKIAHRDHFAKISIDILERLSGCLRKSATHLLSA